MSPASMLALLGMVQTVVQATRQALSLFATVRDMITAGTEPTAVQWAALNAMLATDHAAVQNG